MPVTLAAAVLTLSFLAAGLRTAAPAGAVGSTRSPLSGAAVRLPAGALREGTLSDTRRLSLDVVLKPRDPAALSSFVAAVSNPTSPQYRRYLSAGEFAGRFGPDPVTSSSVRAWLVSAGLTVERTSPDGLVLSVSGPAVAVSDAFATPIDAVRLASGATGYATASVPSVPGPEAAEVQSVVGLDDVAQLRPSMVRVPPGGVTGDAPSAAEALAGTPSPADVGPQACAAAASLAQPGGSHTATQLATAYDFTPLFGQGRTGAGVTLALYELESYAPSDIATYEQCYGVSARVQSVTVDGGPLGAPAGSGEAALDIENAVSFAPGASVLVYLGPQTNTGALDVWEAIASADEARVVSTSWGGCESSLDGLPAAEQVVFSEMAAQGQSVVAASGDTGAQGCFSASGGSNGLTQLAVSDPSSQADVTAVGGTSLPGALTTAGESVWNDCQGLTTACADDALNGAGAGGVSSLWAMPSWQAAAGDGTINAFSGCPGGGGGDCREVPDVTADANPHTGYIVFYLGRWIAGVGGTSASAPLFGGLLADTDQGCAAPLGLVTPALYALGPGGTDFNDVTAGNDDFTDTAGGDYPATAGYDLASGWGSPVGAALLAGLQPAGGCPAVTGLSSTGGPVSGGQTITVSGSGLAGAGAVNFGPGLRGQILADTATSVTVVVPAAPAPLIADVTVTTGNGTSPVVAAARYTYGSPKENLGYFEVAADGGIFAFGDAHFDGSMGGRPLNAPIVGMATTPDGGGYFEVAADGGIFAFGDAHFDGSMGGRRLNALIVGMATTPDGGGYFEVAADGGIFAFGDAHFNGSMGGRPLNAPIVGMATTPDGGGYFEVAADGGIFAFGDAGFFGSMGGRRLNAPIVGMATTPDGGGYFEVAADGGIFAFGDAGFFGSMGGSHLNRPMVAMAATTDSEGYWEAASDGGIFTFGAAGFFGSTGNLVLNAPVVGMAGA